MSRRFARAGGPTGSELIQGNNWVASATPHTVGAWVELDASVAEDCCGLWIGSETVIGVSATDTSMLVELGFGAAASEVSQVQWFVGGAAIYLSTFLPLHIPQGTRLSGRIQGAVASDIFNPIVILEYQNGRFGWGGYSSGTALGLNAATSAPTTGDLTDNAWDEVIASTASPYRALTVHLGINAGAAGTAAPAVDLGVGGAGSEQALGTWFCRTTTSEIMDALIAPRFIEHPVAAGSRIALRKNDVGDLTGHVIGWS